MSVIDDKINSLAKSKFRGSFHLRKYMIDYIKEKGLHQIEEDAYFFIENRLSDTSKVKDGAWDTNERTSCFYRSTCNGYLL